MAKYSANLDGAFSALSDPTRRAIIGQLCEGPKSVSELSEPFAMALPSFMKHVRVLERCGILRSEKIGRVRSCHIEPDALYATEAWVHAHITAWQARLDRMEAHIERIKRSNQEDE